MSESTESNFKPLAIVGIGCLFPQADGLSAYWANILKATDSITDVPATHWDPNEYFDADPKAPDRTYGRRGGFLTAIDFDPLAFGITPNNLEATDTAQLLGLWAADRALKDAGYGPQQEFDRDRVSVILGVTGTLELVIPLGARLGHPVWRKAMRDAGVPDSQAEEAMRRISESYVGWQENSFPGLLGNVVAGRIANRLDLHGTNCVVDAACASSLGAVHLAAMELATGRCDMVVTGGADTFNDIFMYMCFSKTTALSATGAARPFDRDGDGTVLGEGVGVLVLKRLEDARRDGDKIYAAIRSVGSSSDGKGNAVYAPKAEGQCRALRTAYREAGVDPRTIELIEAHGTGTKVGDATELSALTTVFSETTSQVDKQDAWCALGSVKSQIGHTKAAAGVAGLIKAAMALHHKVLPPTIKVKEPLDEFTDEKTPFYLNMEARPWLPRPTEPDRDSTPRRAGISSFGFGGSNFHCVLEEAEPHKAAIDWDEGVELVAFGAADTESLRSRIDSFEKELGSESEPVWEALRTCAAKTRADIDASSACRLALVIERGKTKIQKLLEAVRTKLATDAERWQLPDGAYFEKGNASGKLSALFPGQGSQYVGMLRELACRFPAVQNVLAEADRGFAAERNETPRLSDLVYPTFAFDAEEREANEVRLRATDVAQPAIGALSLGTLRVLGHFGVKPELTAGHSYGELTALHAAGVFDAEAFHAISRTRGRLMADGKGDKGTMLAVQAPLSQVEERVREDGLDVVIANRNAPEQCVLSGSVAEIGKAEAACKQHGLRCKRIPVAAAFHSPLVADAQTPFAEAVSKFEFEKGSIPVYANSTGEPYPPQAEQARERLAGQLSRPVEFVAEIENMYAAGARTFVEVGPGARITGLVRAILGDRDHAAIAVDSSFGKRSGMADLARALAQLAVRGHAVDLKRWNESAEREEDSSSRKPALTIPICGANYVSPKQATETPAPLPQQKKAISSGPSLMKDKPDPAPVASTPIPSPGTPPIAMPAPVSLGAGASDPDVLAKALRATQENMAALQQVQQQTAALHQKFLEGQQNAVQTIQMLIQQQQQLIQGGTGVLPTVSLPAVSIPQPVAPAVPQIAGLPVQPPVEPTAAAPVSLPAATQPAGGRERYERVLLETVAETTGYPRESLELDMELDADLGIDSIKRVEILSVMQEKLPDAPPVQSEHIGTLRTLRQVVDFLCEGMGECAVAEPAGAPAGAAVSDVRITEVLLETVAATTGYPRESLELDMELDADLGIDSIKRVEILSVMQEKMPEAPAVQADHLGTLRTLRQIVDFLSNEAAAAAPASTPIRSATGGVDLERISQGLLEVVADKTGYPVEAVNMDMDLEADLGIDSIKRVEILSVMQERFPEAPMVQAEDMGSLRTLGEIVAFLTASGIGAPPAASAPPTPQETSAPEPAAEATDQTLERFVLSSKDLNGSSDPMVKLSGGTEVWITDAEMAGDKPSLSSLVEARLAELGYEVNRLATDAWEQVECPDRLAGLLIIAPTSGADDAFLKAAFKLLQRAAPGLRKAAGNGGALLATVSRLDGCFGLNGGDRIDQPESGGLAGMAKTAHHEWPEIHVKALDVAGDAKDQENAAAIIDEVFRGGPLEIGLSQGTRWTLVNIPSPLNGEQNAESLAEAIGNGKVVVISGGARGITAEVSVTLAKAFKPTLVLLGRSPAPEPEPDWLASLTSEPEIKRAILEHEAGDSTPSPKVIQASYKKWMANREISENIARIEAHGSKVIYRQVDVRDTDAVSTVISEIRSEVGPIRGLIHGAGVLADRLIEEKTEEQFSLVYDTKVLGLRAMLNALEDDTGKPDEELRVLVFFSSSTGRYGRRGQVDYAVANEVLNKIAQQQARLRPGCRVVSVNWGPWDGGMVSGGLRKVFEQEGIRLIGPRAGAEYLLKEISLNGESPVEVTVLGEGSVVGDGPSEDQKSATVPPADRIPADAPVASKPELPAVFDRHLELDRFPVLKDHVIDGHPVLPMALIAEWFGHGALHGNPGLAFHGFDELRILKGVVLDGGAPYTVRVHAGKAKKAKSDDLPPGSFLVPVELWGGDGDADQRIHARGEILLTAQLPEAPEASIREAGMGLSVYPHNHATVYSEQLFHGQALQGIEEIEGCSEAGILARVRSAPLPAKWVREPLRGVWLSDPLAIDCAYQLMILWCLQQREAGSLPTFAGRYRQFRDAFPGEGVRVAARVKECRGSQAFADIEFVDNEGKLVARMEEYICVLNPTLSASFQKNVPVA